MLIQKKSFFLVCDLDKTLIKVDIYKELLIKALLNSPLIFLKAIFLLLDGKNVSKIFLANKMPLDVIEKAKKNFDERLQKLNWEFYYKDIPFNPSALSLYEWAPIADELKNLDRKIVLNSVILKWDVVKKEFSERINF